MFAYLHAAQMNDEKLKEAIGLLKQTNATLALALDYKYEFRAKSTRLTTLYEGEMEIVNKVKSFLEKNDA